MKIAIFEPDFCHTIGGGNFYSAIIVKYLNEEFPDSIIEIIAHYTVDFDLNNFTSKYYGFSFSKNVQMRFIASNKKLFYVRKISKEYDLFINGIISLYMGKAKKNIHIIHFPKRLPDISNDSLIKKICKYFYYYLIVNKLYPKSYDLFLCNSQFTEKWFKKIWGNYNSMVIYPPVELLNSAFVPKETKLKKTIFMCSRFTPDKNIEFALKTFVNSIELNEKANLIIAGSISNDEEQQNYLSLLKDISKNSTNVKILTNLPRNELLNLYKSSHIFWHAKGYSVDENIDPSAMEHFGITTVEAMSAGLVPVVINKGGQCEIVDENINGFKWNTLEELEMKTVEIIKDETKFQELSKAAWEKSQIYSILNFQNSFSKILKQKKIIDSK